MVSSGFGAIGQKTQQLQNGLNKPKVKFRTYIRFLLLQISFSRNQITSFRSYIRFLLLQILLMSIYSASVQKLYKISTFVDIARNTVRGVQVQKLYKISTFVDWRYKFNNMLLVQKLYKISTLKKKKDEKNFSHLKK